MSKHTPAPWIWSDEYETSSGHKTWSLIGSGTHGILSCDGLNNSPQSLGGQGRADAALIAAAPDLLEALKALYRDLQYYMTPEEVLKACQAINKAEGK